MIQNPIKNHMVLMETIWFLIRGSYQKSVKTIWKFTQNLWKLN